MAKNQYPLLNGIFTNCILLHKCVSITGKRIATSLHLLTGFKSLGSIFTYKIDAANKIISP